MGIRMGILHFFMFDQLFFLFAELCEKLSLEFWNFEMCLWVLPSCKWRWVYVYLIGFA